MLKTRVITAIIGLIIAIAAVTIGGFFFNVLILVLSLLGWRELTQMLQKNKQKIATYWGFIVTILCVGALSMNANSIALAIAFLAILLLFICYIFGKIDFSTVAYTLLGFFYVSVGFISLIIIRNDLLYSYLESMPYKSIPLGASFIWIMLLCTWASDTFAYFAGSKWGKRKIVPTISPNKSLEGFIGGFLGCLLTGIVTAFLFGISLEIGSIIGVLIGIFAPLGDLFESKLKRDCQIKDSGILLPGHGGVLDRFDSILFGAPIILMYLMQF